MFGRRGALEPEFERCTALTLRRVVPIARRATVGGITVALSALELHEGGKSVLRYLISIHPDSEAFEMMSRGLPKPELQVKDGSGRSYDVSYKGSGATDGNSAGEVRILGLPDTGDLEIKVTGVYSRASREEPTERRDGPWTFRFAIQEGA